MPSYKHLDQMLPWNDKVQVLECVAVLPETQDCKTFSFQSTEPSWFRYTPGQFVTLELPVGPVPALRTYTLSSSPSRPLSIAVTVKAQRDSVATRWMLDNLKVGDRLKAFGPSGTFSFHNHPAEKYLFISAGSGITPMMSMTRWLYDYARHTDISFINCARRPSEIIFRAELERMATRDPNIKLAWIVEESDPYEVWPGFRGRINALMLELAVPDYRSREIFCCGPEPFMRNVREMLAAAGCDMARYHEESFHPSTEAEAAPIIVDGFGADAAETAAEIVFTRSGITAECTSADTVLQIARTAGLNIPSGCQFGVCGTCKTRKLSGEVQMSHNGGILDEEVEEGFILACCSRPVGRIEVEI
ncbi:hybrid-cluster NAD(P)-dependent oxidoreductase [Mangrovicella endophytica]|uniref:hybrid-cluster NAD(P)-dependent oxidoreductase n=1 Tax=Mangrovicella endophytica TaxID=2066697 RepID=UPI001300146A|nr:hybrid-cluster NAD(P)-dependent oxidoreductase [Mangrovicella endophytica]